MVRLASACRLFFCSVFFGSLGSAFFFIAFVCRRLADPNLPCRAIEGLKMIPEEATGSSIQQFIHLLTNEGHEHHGEAWGRFLFNIEQAQGLGLVDKATAVAIIQAGVRWSTADGWTTSKASQKLYHLTAVPLVTGDIRDYKHAWLYALTMFWAVEVETLALTDRAAEAAFGLVAVLSGETGTEEEGAGAGARAQEAPEEEAPQQLAWEESEEHLPSELKHLWDKVQRRDNKLNLKDLLTAVPVFQELPKVAPVNNHRQDGRSSHDKVMRAYQQSMLHLLRLLAFGYMAITSHQDESTLRTIFEQIFQYVIEIAQKIEDGRKESSIPGSIPSQSASLFDKEDIQNANLTSKINSTGRFVPRYCYPAPPRFALVCPPLSRGGGGKGPYRFRSFKGFGKSSFKGYGSQSGWKSYGSSKGSGRGKGLPSRADYGSQHALFSQGEIQDRELAGYACTMGGATGDPERCAAQLAPARLPVLPCKRKRLLRDSTGRKSVAAVLGRGCRKRSTSHRHKTFGSLVHHPKRGRILRKVAIDCRLSRIESVFRAKTLQDGSLAFHLSLPKERHVGRQNRPKGRLFSFGPRRGPQALRKNASWAQSLRIPGSMLWVKHPSPAMDAGDESPAKSLEVQGDYVFPLPGRHSLGGANPPPGAAAFGHHAGVPSVVGTRNQREKEHPETCPGNRALGVLGQFSGGHITSARSEIEIHSERVGKVGDSKIFDTTKNGCHFRQRTLISHGHALFKGFHRPAGPVFRAASKFGLGQKTSSPSGNIPTSERVGFFDEHLARPLFRGLGGRPEFTFRLLRPGLGWGRRWNWKFGPGFLEGKGFPPHQCEGTPRRRRHGDEFVQGQGKSPSESGQFGSFQLPHKRGGVGFPP